MCATNYTRSGLLFALTSSRSQANGYIMQLLRRLLLVLIMLPIFSSLQGCEFLAGAATGAAATEAAEEIDDDDEG